MKHRINNLVKMLSVIVCASQLTLSAQNGEATFKQICGACHSIGKGKLVGPDLKDVTKKRNRDWIVKFVKGSQALIKSGDADAKAISDEFNGMVMPDQNISDADLNSVLAYIEEQSGGAAVSEPVSETKPVESKASEPASADLITKGKEYFEGSRAFKNGGASCLSCHNANYSGMISGGVLAKDVTNAYSRLGGDAGLNGILASPPFPAMTAAFKNNPLTDEEIKAITAFLKATDDPSKSAPEGMNPLLIGGFVGFVILFIIILGLWRKRKILSSKNDYHNRQLKNSN